ncbi:hypothetical protein CTA1_7820, partial [Colletotrichum tanaceti]
MSQAMSLRSNVAQYVPPMLPFASAVRLVSWLLLSSSSWAEISAVCTTSKNAPLPPPLSLRLRDCLSPSIRHCRRSTLGYRRRRRPDSAKSLLRVTPNRDRVWRAGSPCSTFFPQSDRLAAPAVGGEQNGRLPPPQTKISASWTRADHPWFGRRASASPWRTGGSGESEGQAKGEGQRGGGAIRCALSSLGNVMCDFGRPFVFDRLSRGRQMSKLNPARAPFLQRDRQDPSFVDIETKQHIAVRNFRAAIGDFPTFACYA